MVAKMRSMLHHHTFHSTFQMWVIKNLAPIETPDWLCPHLNHFIIKAKEYPRHVILTLTPYIYKYMYTLFIIWKKKKVSHIDYHNATP